MDVINNGAEVNSNNDNKEESIKEARLTIAELQRAATRDHSGGPCPAGSFGGMFPRRSAEAGPRGLQSLFSAMVKRPNCKRQIVEDEFIRAGRDVSPAGPGDSAVVCRTGDRAAG